MIERTLAFGPGGALVGTVCLPDDGARPAVGLVLFNAGMVHRVGPHRLNVRLARHLAAGGIPSIRFDLSGQGDSARPAGNAPFEQQAVSDLRVAMDALAEAAGVARFALFGFCSGGVHGYAAAQADARVAGLLMYDTYMFRTVRSKVNRYLLRIRQRGFFPAVLGGLARRPFAPGKPAARGGIGQFPTPKPQDFVNVVRALHERGTRVDMVISGSFLELYNYPGQFRDAFAGTGIEALVDVTFLPSMEHNATLLEDQAGFIRCIADWTVKLDRRWQPQAGG